MVRKLVVAAALMGLAAVVAAAYLVLRGPDLDAFEKFREPALIDIPEQRVLVVEASGDPDTAGRAAFSHLFATYHRLEGVSRGATMPAPRARWPRGLDTARDQWIGRYALPAPGSVVALPPAEPAPGLVAKLETWQYGEVAQILHVGPYGAETPTIERLRAFIKAKDREIAGDHEEEYLRGPGMFSKGNPARYYTLIRYPVRKKPAE